jgi:hypothetical protein
MSRARIFNGRSIMSCKERDVETCSLLDDHSNISKESKMMNGMMDGSGMGGMAIGWLLGVTVLILAVFALIKYLRSK